MGIFFYLDLGRSVDAWPVAGVVQISRNPLPQNATRPETWTIARLPVEEYALAERYLFGTLIPSVSVLRAVVSCFLDVLPDLYGHYLIFPFLHVAFWVAQIQLVFLNSVLHILADRK